MTDVAIVGAGLAGLTCAQDLTRAGLQCTVLEGADGVGGRVRTDAVDGFLLDRGFQILLSAYPQVKQRLDTAALDIGPLRARRARAQPLTAARGSAIRCAGLLSSRVSALARPSGFASGQAARRLGSCSTSERTRSASCCGARGHEHR